MEKMLLSPNELLTYFVGCCISVPCMPICHAAPPAPYIEWLIHYGLVLPVVGNPLKTSLKIQFKNQPETYTNPIGSSKP